MLCLQIYSKAAVSLCISLTLCCQKKSRRSSFDEPKSGFLLSQKGGKIFGTNPTKSEGTSIKEQNKIEWNSRIWLKTFLKHFLLCPVSSLLQFYSSTFHLSQVSQVNNSSLLFLLVIGKWCLPLVKKMHIDIRPSTEVFFYGLKPHNSYYLDIFIHITVMLKFTHLTQQRKIK